MKAYAGIGSHETPQVVCDEMRRIARYLVSCYTLRSGGADGADTAFEQGCDDMGLGSKQIFLPWKGFNGNGSLLFRVGEDAMVEAKRFHPNWYGLQSAGRCLMGRNAYQVLGLGLDDPVKFILFWTKDGKASGGTGQALRMAKFYKIPTFCIGRDEFNPEDYI